MSSVVMPGLITSPTTRSVSAAMRHASRSNSISFIVLISTELMGTVPRFPDFRANRRHLLVASEFAEGAGILHRGDGLGVVGGQVPMHLGVICRGETPEKTDEGVPDEAGIDRLDQVEGRRLAGDGQLEAIGGESSADDGRADGDEAQVVGRHIRHPVDGYGRDADSLDDLRVLRSLPQDRIRPRRVSRRRPSQSRGGDTIVEELGCAPGVRGKPFGRCRVRRSRRLTARHVSRGPQPEGPKGLEKWHVASPGGAALRCKG